MDRYSKTLQALRTLKKKVNYIFQIWKEKIRLITLEIFIGALRRHSTQKKNHMVVKHCDPGWFSKKNRLWTIFQRVMHFFIFFKTYTKKNDPRKKAYFFIL